MLVQKQKALVDQKQITRFVQKQKQIISQQQKRKFGSVAQGFNGNHGGACRPGSGSIPRGSSILVGIVSPNRLTQLEVLHVC